VNRQYRRKHATSTVRAGSLILAPAEGSLTPQIGDPALHHKDQLVCGGEQAIPKKACDLHGARWLFDLDKTSRLKEKSVYIAAIYQPILGILAIHAKPCQPYTLITRNSPF
jgi:hypothetical protein